MQGIESLDALLRCQQKVMKMIEVIKVKQQTDPATGRNVSSPGRTRRNKFLEGAIPHGNNVRVDTKEERVAEDRRVPEEEEEITIVAEEEEEMYTRDSMKSEANMLIAEKKRFEERQVGS